MFSPRKLMAGSAAATLGLLLLAQGALAQPATGSRGMLVASQGDAARAGLEMLEAGGNAVDAAVATAFALSVAQPFSAGLGGGVFVLIRRGCSTTTVPRTGGRTGSTEYRKPDQT